MSKLKKLTILHSNDMHGDFFADGENGKLIGGVSMLSGYIDKVRSQEKNTLYVVSGDMFRGSVIDSEFKGISTIEIMNMLAPDVATLGNHEIDYGMGHLLFLEKCARFPIINANMYLTTTQTRLFNSHTVIEIDGMKILFIGVITESVLAQARQEKLIGSFINVHEASAEIGRICNAYKTDAIDLTVLLTHIGFDEDKKLASLLDPRWGVDLIIGGHSHTFLSEPCVVSGIPIVQAVTGTDQIGRFDLKVDTEKKSVSEYKWELVPIDDSHCPRDLDLEELLSKYSAVADEKYSRYVTHLSGVFTHPTRKRESQLGKFIADRFKEGLGVDIMLLASGSLRVTELGPRVTFRDLMEMFPFQEEVYGVTVTGLQLKQMINYIFRPEAFGDGHTEFYQFSKGIRAVVSMKEGRLTDLTFNGEPIDEGSLFRIGLQGYHFSNMRDFFGISREEVEVNGPIRILSTCAMDVLDESLSSKAVFHCPDDDRWITLE